MRLKYFEIIFCFLIFLSCHKENRLIGNYFICGEGEYVEVYFKKDSMRVAADNFWVRLSEWRKIKVKNDTLYFETFGEWRDSSKAIIIPNGANKILLYYFESTKDTVSLMPISENLNFESTEDFWKDFRKRQKSSKCKAD